MKIAINLFDNSKMGGILTLHNNLIDGLRKNGHSVTSFFLSSNSQIIKMKYGCNFGIGFKKGFEYKYRILMHPYDLIIFSHPCPSLNKSFSDKSWQMCYNVNKPIISVFHDPFWRMYYPWIEDVFGRISHAVAVQEKSYNSIKSKLKTKIIRHPLNLDDMGCYEKQKEDLVISPHQFKTWKNIDLFIRAIPNIRHKVEVFNGGIEYHYMSGMKRKEKYKIENRWIWDDAISAGMIYKGYVNSELITDAFKRQKSVVDMSVGELGNKLHVKSVNYSVLECMKYGGVPIVRDNTLIDGLITDDMVVVVDENDIVDSISSKCNHVIDTFFEYAPMISRNFKFLQSNFDNRVIATKYLELI